MNSYSLHNLDIRMLEYINFKNGFFVECGANDGISQSNTLLLEKNLEWTGLLVEPNKLKFDMCFSNRNNSIVENYALVSSSYNKSYISGNFNETHEGESLMAMVIEDGDWQSSNVVKSKQIKQESRQIVQVPVTTLDNLFTKHNINKIDFFSLDVEGYEISVLNGMDFKIYRPTYFLIETSNDVEIQNKIREYMHQKNYRFIKPLSGNDDLFINDLI